MTTQIENIAKATSNPGSRIYHRGSMDSLQQTENRSVIYSRAQARKIFERYPKIETVELTIKRHLSAIVILLFVEDLKGIIPTL